MKKIEAIIKPFKLDEVRESLSEIGVTGLTVTEVKGFGGRRATPSCIAVLNMGRLPAQVKIEIVVANGNRRAGHQPSSRPPTGQDRRRQIFVTAVEQVVRIRTGETNEAAI